VNVRDVGIVQGGEHFGFALEPGETLRIAGDRRRQDLNGDLAFEVRIGGAIQLTHTTDAERRGDFVGAEAPARIERHLWKEWFGL